MTAHASRLPMLGLLAVCACAEPSSATTSARPPRATTSGAEGAGDTTSTASSSTGSTASSASAGASAEGTPDEPLAELPPLPELARRCDASDGAGPSAPSLQRLRGQVSYYADALHGRRTASGEPYDKHELTAASRTLPFGSLVRIRRRDAPNHAVVVRVNDRGPFGRNRRILDLSRAAAECLDMIRRGVVEVDAEVIRRGPG